MIATARNTANALTTGRSEGRVRATGTFNLLDPLPAVAIGWSETAKQFRKCIGKKIDGKPRIFWLGRDEDDARFTASVLSWCFNLMQTQGHGTGKGNS